MKRLHFVSAPGGSAFMHELLTVVAHEVGKLAGEAGLGEITVSEGGFPSGGDDDVYVVVPHEYFVVLPAESHPTPAQLSRTIGFCVEHPGTKTFETTARLATSLAACVDINDDSTVALAELGIQTERFVLGYSDRWDRWGGVDGERRYDVVYLGSSDQRRSRLLALDFETLSDFELFYAMPPHDFMTRPMSQPRPDFLMGEAKLGLLASSKVLLNLHREQSRSLEWVRVLEAMCNGCVVVSEHSLDFAPLRPGEHLLFGRPRTLVHLARTVLGDAARLRALREAAYAALRSSPTMSRSALLLAQLAVAVGDGSVRPPAATTRVPTRMPTWPPELAGRLVAEAVSGRRATLRIARPSWTPVQARGRALAPLARHAAPDVAIVCAPGSRRPDETIASVEAQLDSPDSVIHVCLDGVEAHGIPTGSRIAVHGGGVVRTGVGAPLRVVLETSRAQALLVLDAGDRLAPRALERLRIALQSEDADAAYGMVVTPNGRLKSSLPFEPWRLRWSDYIATASLWRFSSLQELGGWSEDPALDGAETWDLWRRLAASGGFAVLVPRPLVRQAFAQDPPASRYEIDLAGVVERLEQRVPALAAL